MDRCGTTDVRSLLISGLILILSPFIFLYLLCLVVYCRRTDRVFLQKELEEAKTLPPIILK